ncbi:Hypothetical protein PENO1_036920 [Penicillium occitanis (nom. inval.)]|nr:Hypothetical protein PENO1_036920 [Penicillium occitanis (nom. inval.)]PCH09799.1 hypothetical protein PENOC_008110 [Penicillium occitanis (nom. inval.)]
MPKVHRPDFEAFKNAKRKESREAYMWPHINLEDMEQPRPLLLLLKSSARNAPHLFLHADLEASKLGRGIGAIRFAFLRQYTMIFVGRMSPQKYGELISWDDHDHAFDWLNSGWGLHPGYGLLALEIQQQIYKFLLEYTRQILHEITEESLIADFPVLPEPTINDEGDWHSLAAVAADAPYRLPAGLDLDSIITIIDGKRSASEDHLLALREDPGYFAGVVNAYKEHRQEILLDTRNLWFALKQFMIVPVAVLKMATPASPPLRSLWVRDPPELGTSTMRVQTRENVSMSKSQTELLWILNMFWDDSSPILRVGRKTLMDELECLVQSDPKNKELVSFQKATEPAIQTQPKTKVKSRGEPTKSANIVEPELNPRIDDAQPLFKVDKRAFKVFSTLFFQPSQSSQPGEIPWNDFLHAMASTAFAVEKLYGSVWQFSPRNSDVERSIQFHEPHPIAKIPFRMARRIGRRLNRAYGWNGDMFKSSS